MSCDFDQSKTISQWEFDFSLCYKFTKNYNNVTLLRFNALVTFLRVHSNSKEVSYLSWQNMYPNLKTLSHIKLKFFLWTKLLENLVLAKYLICRCTFNVHHKDWLICSGGTDWPGELCYNFSFSNDLTQMVNFPTWIQTVILMVLLFGFTSYFWR